MNPSLRRVNPSLRRVLLPHVQADNRRLVHLLERTAEFRRLMDDIAQVGLQTAVKPLFSRSTTGEFLNFSPKYSQTLQNCPR